MEYASQRLRPGRMLIWTAGLAAGLWLAARMAAVLQQSYLDEALVRSAASGNAALVAPSIRRGANPNALTPDGRGFLVPVLFVAIRKGDTALCRELLEHGARPEATELGRDGRPHFNAIMEAARLGKAPVVRLFLEHGANANAHDNEGFTALMCAAVSGDTATVQLLMDHGADVNLRDSHGLSPLLMAEAQHQDAVWSQLTKAGATR
jgi:hypothetical protein